MRVRSRVVTGLVVFLAGLGGVEACGPDFAPDTFVRVSRPDNLAEFAQGRLGIVQTGYDSSELAVAFRYLNGGRLSEPERALYLKPTQVARDWRNLTAAQIDAAREVEAAALPVNQWKAARRRYLGDGEPEGKGLPAPIEDFYQPGILNCPNAAFATATLTLTERAARWGGKSTWLADWIHGQDAVFSNCEGKTGATPSAAPADSPAMLKADRQYQKAAAAFYAARYDEAREGFDAVARDAASPWHAWGGYLAARALVRKAFAMGKKADDFNPDLADFDRATMEAAQQLLERLLSEEVPGVPRDAVVRELNFVRLRTEPESRAAEIAAALAGPGPDVSFGQDLKDLDFLLYKHVTLKTQPPLLIWIATLRDASSQGTETAIAQWKHTHALPWLVLALMKAQAGSAAAGELLAEAARVGSADPAYETVAFQRIRLLSGRGQRAEARKLADAMVERAGKGDPGSDLNAFLGERMALAGDFEDWLKYAPRTLVEEHSQGFFAREEACARPTGVSACRPEANRMELDADSVSMLNQQTPMERLVEAANSRNLPAGIRQEVALAAWTRGVLLEDAEDAAKLSGQLPDPLQGTAREGIGFKAILTLLRNPGLRPVLEPGISRLSSYGALDAFRGNWWCSPFDNVSARVGSGGASDAGWGILTDAEQAKGVAEYARLMDMPPAPIYLGQRAVDYAKQHPQDPDVPEALALTVRATHYGCLNWGTNSPEEAGRRSTAVSKAAFRLLHEQFPHSKWAAETRYYY